jgi:hypothetical protein
LSISVKDVARYGVHRIALGETLTPPGCSRNSTQLQMMRVWTTLQAIPAAGWAGAI